MVNTPVNATGWAELIDGNMLGAVYTMFDTAFGGMGLIVVILFFVYQVMLYAKTGNLFLVFTTGMFFASLYATSVFVEAVSVQIIFLLLVLEFAGVLYLLFFTRKQ